MQYIHAFVGCLFIVIALFQVLHPSPWSWAPYSVAAVLAFVTLVPVISLSISRILAIATTALMFYFFAAFFLLVPELGADDWYMKNMALWWAAGCKLLGAFAMIPVLSDFSCRLKAECNEARLSERRAFFSVPDHIPPHT